jgi:hypothetical protein
MRRVLTGVVTVGLLGLVAFAQTPPAKADVVMVAGCLKESPPGTWTLVNASDPVVSVANAPSAKELAESPKGGKNEFRLIGGAVFNLPAHRDHAVVVKGLQIKAAPISRLNLTSVTMVAPTCPPRDPK